MESNVHKEFIKEHIIECNYCGNKTLMKEVARYDRCSYNWFPDGTCELDFEGTIYQSFKCPICSKLTYTERDYGYPDNDSLPGYFDLKIIYPKLSTDFTDVPDKIKSAFLSAYKVRAIDSNVCLMALRRTLEMICVDKGAGKYNLDGKVSELVENGTLPPMMRDLCNIVRERGSKAAHQDGRELSKEELERVIEYISTIIEYLYSIPSKVKKDLNKIDKEKSTE